MRLIFKIKPSEMSLMMPENKDNQYHNLQVTRDTALKIGKCEILGISALIGKDIICQKPSKYVNPG